MSRIVLARVAWLVIGHALLVALFWGFVNVPDSNALMVALSTAVLALLIATLAVVHGTAAAWLLAHGESRLSSSRRWPGASLRRRRFHRR